MHPLIGQASFSLRVQRHEWRHFHFALEYWDMDDVTKTRQNLGYFYKTNRNRDRNMNDAISTGKIQENTRLYLVFSPGIFPVEMTSFMFLSQHGDTQVIFYLLNKYPIKNHSRKSP